jgi:hypothetical protein
MLDIVEVVIKIKVEFDWEKPQNLDRVPQISLQG